MSAKKSRVDKNWFKNSTSIEEMSRKKFGFETADHITIDDLPDWITLKVAAQKVGCSPSTIKAKCQNGEILGRKICGKWRIPVSELAALMKAG